MAVKNKRKFAKVPKTKGGVPKKYVRGAKNPKAREEEIKETESKLRKQIAQLRMARYTLIGMGVFTAAMFFMPIEKINALSDISNLLYISGAGIVGTYMGTTAWMARK